MGVGPHKASPEGIVGRVLPTLRPLEPLFVGNFVDGLDPVEDVKRTLYSINCSSPRTGVLPHYGLTVGNGPRDPNRTSLRSGHEGPLLVGLQPELTPGAGYEDPMSMKWCYRLSTGRGFRTQPHGDRERCFETENLGSLLCSGTKDNPQAQN